MPALFIVTPLSVRWPPLVWARSVAIVPASRFSSPPPDTVAALSQFIEPATSSALFRARLRVPPDRFNAPWMRAPDRLTVAPPKLAMPFSVEPVAKVCVPALKRTLLPTMLKAPTWLPPVCSSRRPVPESTVPPSRLLKRTRLVKALLPLPPVLATVPLLLKLPPRPEFSVTSPSVVKLKRPLLLKVVPSLISSWRPSLA